MSAKQYFTSLVLIKHKHESGANSHVMCFDMPDGFIILHHIQHNHDSCEHFNTTLIISYYFCYLCFLV